jgi:hypothetical protein
MRKNKKNKNVYSSGIMLCNIRIKVDIMFLLSKTMLVDSEKDEWYIRLRNQI